MFKTFRKIISFTLIIAFIGSSLNIPKAQAGEMVMPIMPRPGTMVNLSPEYTPAYLKGIVIHPDNALKFDFLVRKGDGDLDQGQKMQEYNKLIKYFLAALTVPDDDQWVNLSPYEKNKIVQGDFGKTEMGRDLLSQDYLLKQITSSLMYPDSDLGKTFWDKVYQRAYEEFGTTNIPVNTFNKVWIVPDDALIYESGNTAYVVKSHLKVMLEEDYLSLKKHTAIVNPDPKQNALHAVSSRVIKEIILPELEREVNEGKNFAMLRQVFSGMLLATWYKKALRESLLGEVYADKAKVRGVDQNPANNEVIYRQYLAAFKKGVYNYIKEDTDKYTNEVIPRKYFAGGFLREGPEVDKTVDVSDTAMAAAMTGDNAMTEEDLAAVQVDQAQASPAMTINDQTPIEDVWDVIKKNPRAFLQQVQARSKVPIKKVLVLSSNVGGGGVEDEYTPREFAAAVPTMRDMGAKGELTLEFNDDKDLPSIVKIRQGEIGQLTESHDFGRADTFHSSVVEALEFVRDMAQLTAAQQLPGAETNFKIYLNGYGVSEAEQKGWSDYIIKRGNLSYVTSTGIPVEGSRATTFNIGKNRLSVKAGGINYIVPDAAMQSSEMTLEDFRQNGGGKAGDIYTFNLKGGQHYTGELEPGLDRSDLWAPISIKRTDNGELFAIDPTQIKGPIIIESRMMVNRPTIAPSSDIVDLKRAMEMARAKIGAMDESSFPDREVVVGRLNEMSRANVDSDLADKVKDIYQQYAAILGPMPTVYRADTGRITDINLTPLAETQRGQADLAMKGGIDLNAANLDLQIKRDGNGVPLPISQQDMAQLANISGFVPKILEIKPVSSLPLLSEAK